MKPNSPESKDFTLEIHIRLNLNDYKSKLGTKKAWLIAIGIALLKVAIRFCLVS